MFSKLLGMLSADMAIALGTATPLVYVNGRGIVLNEPSVVATASVKGRKQVHPAWAQVGHRLGPRPGHVMAI